LLQEIATTPDTHISERRFGKTIMAK